VNSWSITHLVVAHAVPLHFSTFDMSGPNFLVLACISVLVVYGGAESAKVQFFGYANCTEPVFDPIIVKGGYIFRLHAAPLRLHSCLVFITCMALVCEMRITSLLSYACSHGGYPAHTDTLVSMLPLQTNAKTFQRSLMPSWISTSPITCTSLRSTTFSKVPLVQLPRFFSLLRIARGRPT
jgi:hypothetical protein